MEVERITDVVQLINLTGFAACLVFALLIGWRWRWTRLWLLPLITFLINGTLFYLIAIADLWTSPVRTMWSAGLRLHVLILIVAGLTTMWVLLRNRDAASS